MTTHFETLVNRELIAVDIEPADRGDLTLETFGGQIFHHFFDELAAKGDQKASKEMPGTPQTAPKDPFTFQKRR